MNLHVYGKTPFRGVFSRSGFSGARIPSKESGSPPLENASPKRGFFMAKMTYWEQLKHPLWQRRRLEKMSCANFRCEECDTDQVTLNVHHKQYFKSRMAWEYEDHELCVLCEPCHEEAHHVDERIKQILTMVEAREVFSLLCGYFTSSEVDPGLREEGRQDDPYTYANGFIARMSKYLLISKMREVAKLAVELSHETAESRPMFQEEATYVFWDD